MFEDVLLSSPRSRAPALVISYVLQFILVGALVLVPLLHMEALPRLLTAEHLAPPPSPPPPSAPSLATRRAAQRTNLDEVLREPPSIPTTIAVLNEKPLPPQEAAGNGFGVPGGIPNGIPGGIPIGVPGGMPWGTTPPPPPQPKPVNTRPLRVGGNVILAKLVYHPEPQYPPVARMARIQGTVLLEAVIGKDGTIQELKLLSGPALLAPAALEAVARWRYQPTLLNNEPVEVLTEISVRFTLAE
jgi:protein TonB